MALASDIAAQGTLTGSPTVDTVYTASGTCMVTVVATNNGASNRTIQMYINGTAASNKIGGAITLDLGGGFVIYENVKMGNGDTLRLMASAATDVVYTVEVDTL